MKSEKIDRKTARLRKKWRKTTVKHIVLCVATALAIALADLFLLLALVFWGPSQTACDLLAQATLESSALKFVPHLFFSDEGVNEILARNTIVAPVEETDTALITVDTGASEADAGEENYQPIEIERVTGSTYKGYMMIVRDPSRVIVGTSATGAYNAALPGKQLHEIVAHYEAAGGINAGGFMDVGGVGNGGTPIGLVISQGNLMSYATADPTYKTVIGFDQDDKLIVAAINTDKALSLGLRDAISFGPALIVNGVSAAISGTSSGVNPRSAIGQRADGAVLLLVIDGRQADSIGATYADLIDVMQQYGAVNAANLDGGSSSTMYYRGEQLNDGVMLTGSRKLPTAFIVLDEEEK